VSFTAGLYYFDRMFYVFGAMLSVNCNGMKTVMIKTLKNRMGLN